jgi:tripartite-type tricarboxylate transporter receptor subunit TctC
VRRETTTGFAQVLLFVLLVLGGVAHGGAPVQAQSYPAKPITIVVAYPAGGATDVIARAVAQRLSADLGQSIVIDNKGGASTQIGASYVAKAPADGYTLLATDQTTFVNSYLYSKLAYDPEADFVPVTGLGIIHQALVVHPSFPARSVAELIAAAKAAPDSLNFATIGIGSSSHLSMEMFESMAGLRLNPIHYKGGAPALTDVIAGHVPMVFLSATLTAQPAKAGQLRPLGIGSNARIAQFADVPTIAETLPGYESAVWFGFFAPRGTPPDIVTMLNGAVQKILTDPEFRASFLVPNFYEPILSSPDQFGAYVRDDAKKWGRVIQDAKLTLN